MKLHYDLAFFPLSFIEKWIKFFLNEKRPKKSIIGHTYRKMQFVKIYFYCVVISLASDVIQALTFPQQMVFQLSDSGFHLLFLLLTYTFLLLFY